MSTRMILRFHPAICSHIPYIQTYGTWKGCHVIIGPVQTSYMRLKNLGSQKINMPCMIKHTPEVTTRMLYMIHLKLEGRDGRGQCSLELFLSLPRLKLFHSTVPGKMQFKCTQTWKGKVKEPSHFCHTPGHGIVVMLTWKITFQGGIIFYHPILS